MEVIKIEVIKIVVIKIDFIKIEVIKIEVIKIKVNKKFGLPLFLLVPLLPFFRHISSNGQRVQRVRVVAP